MAAALVLLVAVPQVWALTGREIMDKNDALPEADTGESKVMMFVHKGSRTLEKEFEIISKKFPNDEDKTLIAFKRPTRIKLLTHAHKSRDDDQWLRLSSGKIKRIAGSDKGKSFVNSHFYYEDLTSRDIDDYDYKLLGEETVKGESCYKVEAVKREKKDRVYTKSILYVRKSDYFIVRIDLFKNNKFHKYVENSDVRKIDGILTPFEITMTLANGKGDTQLKVQSVTYNENIPSRKFNKEALR